MQIVEEQLPFRPAYWTDFGWTVLIIVAALMNAVQRAHVHDPPERRSEQFDCKHGEQPPTVHMPVNCLSPASVSD